MPFGTNIVGDVFQRKLDQCFGHLQNVIVIADDIMVIGKQPNHKDHDLALTTLLNTARKCNVCLNYEKLQYKQTEVKFFGESYTIDGCKPVQSKIKAIQEMPAPQCKSRYSHLLAWLTTCQSSQLGYLSLQSQSEIYVKRKYPSTGDWSMMVHSN